MTISPEVTIALLGLFFTIPQLIISVLTWHEARRLRLNPRHGSMSPLKISSRLCLADTCFFIPLHQAVNDRESDQLLQRIFTVVSSSSMDHRRGLRYLNTNPISHAAAGPSRIEQDVISPSTSPPFIATQAGIQGRLKRALPSPYDVRQDTSRMTWPVSPTAKRPPSPRLARRVGKAAGYADGTDTSSPYRRYSMT